MDTEAIKQRFREAGGRVNNGDDGYFEVVQKLMPASTLVRANPYFVEFNTLIWARPKSFFGKKESKRDSRLNRMNQVTKVAKVTCDQTSIETDEGGWRLQVMARFVSGSVESDFEPEMIDRWMKIWLQDIAKLIIETTGFEVVAMFRDLTECE